MMWSLCPPLLAQSGLSLANSHDWPDAARSASWVAMKKQTFA
nr:hypothetical protein JVH1_4226 [Rhodococcus sp. JVH1]